MAKLSSQCLFFLFLCLLTLCSSGTKLGFLYNAREKNTGDSSITRKLSVLEENKVYVSYVKVLAADHSVLSSLSSSNVSVHLYLDDSLVENFLNSKSSAILWVKTFIFPFMPRVNIRSLVLRGGNDMSRVLSSMKLISSVLRDLGFDNEVKVSVAFSLSFLESLDRKQENELNRVLGFIKRLRSFVVVEGSFENSVESMIKKATLVSSILDCDDVDVVMTLESSIVDPSDEQVIEFAAMALQSLENSQIAELYVEVSSVAGFVAIEQEQIFHSARRELMKTVSHDAINPPITLPSDNPTPTIVTVPATNPVTITPGNPASAPIQIPSTTPILFPPSNPAVNPPVPFTTPVSTPAAPITVPGMQPITNPVTTYPAPTGNVPGTTPAVNPVTPPATTNAPAVPGQSWCIAKSGVSETALQSALDYACGMGGADCSQIQQGGNCYNPSTLQNHASYAFNSYYQKNPTATSCDFGGTASIVSSNPSTGSCVFPSSSSSSTSSSSSPPASTSSLPTPSTPTTTPITNPATTPSTPMSGDSGTVTPPSVLNSSSPGSETPTVFGSDTPPGFNTSTSRSASLRPFFGSIILVTIFVARTITLDI
ncbi:glucan endo-1,3-beta-glucosidase 12-like [Mercurialis annua]|uniref:glucan endo-1,3-beta-glucosidase 12-like n=1 Tax=Mercurialis annua TaxID=3986 RepID=UPI00215FACF8|nr:glucan endo-1,3-beta-glucosidase 12-like [Mercurialis annua]